MAAPQLNIKNKRARFEYHLEDTFQAGIVLSGTEIKSIRNGKASILEAYCIFHEGEVWIRNMFVNEYENPLKLFLSDKGWVKIEIACAVGKKLHDKRHDLKMKDDQREMDRALKR